MVRQATTRSEFVPDQLRGEELEVAKCVEARFRRSGYPYLRGIKCQVLGGKATLLGSVPTFHLKQLAQELAVHTTGVWQVDNCIQVPKANYYSCQADARPHAATRWTGEEAPLVADMRSSPQRRRAEVRGRGPADS
jgi:hypothetical protein